MRKELTPESMQEIYITLALGFNFVDLKMSDLPEAADMKWRDFEGSVQSAIASRIKADYIITRNVKDFQGSKTPAISPEYYFTNIFII